MTQFRMDRNVFSVKMDFIWIQMAFVRNWWLLFVIKEIPFTLRATSKITSAITTYFTNTLLIFQVAVHANLVIKLFLFWVKTTLLASIQTTISLENSFKIQITYRIVNTIKLWIRQEFLFAINVNKVSF